MFDGHYESWRKSRLDTTINILTDKFMAGKNILEVGCGHGHIGNFFQTEFPDCRVTCCDGRKEHVEKIKENIQKNVYSQNLTTEIYDLEEDYSLETKKFDVIIHWGVLYHISDVKKHMTDILSHCDYVLLETEVCDSEEDICKTLGEGGYDQAVSGTGSRPSPSHVEGILTENGFEFRRILDCRLNSGSHVYDWKHTNDGHHKDGLRRFWICWKSGVKTPLQAEKKYYERRVMPPHDAKKETI
jgi:cyclopropane fatty-acyl-phospholipid synthase-like methyltransferase